MTQPASKYDDRMLDSLGSQRYTEQQMLYMRKVQSLEHDLDALEEKRKALEASISMGQLEVGAGKLQASDSEAVRMGDYAGATQQSQTRIAHEVAQQAVQQALIENDRDRQLMEAELESNRRMVELDQKYSISIQDAENETDKAKLKGDLEVEKAKAEAQRKKALIEADATRDLSSLEQSYDSRISEAKRSAASISQAATQVSQSQRIKVALANADAQRRVKDDITSIRESVSALNVEKNAAAQPLHDQLSKLSEQIVSLQGKLAGVEAGYDAKIVLQQAQLDDLAGQSQALAEVEQTLINSPVLSTGYQESDPVGRSVQVVESELQRAKSDLLVRKSNLLADVDRELSRDIGLLATNLNRVASDQPATNNRAAARFEKATSESVLRSELAAKRTQINNDARSQIAELVVKTEIAKASVVGPVVTGRAVYSSSYGAQPAAFAARESNVARELIASAKTLAKPPAVVKRAPPSESIQVAKTVDTEAPLLVASSFEPRPVRETVSRVDDVVIASGTMSGGDVQPLVVTPSTTNYTVVYRYAEKGSAEKFMAYLDAYGIKDFKYSYSEKLKQHILFMGRYSSKDKAAGRVAFLNKTTSTSNAQIVETDL
ncbi:hypothetical protein ACI77O_13105 [Pseudomonas tritici]|uniref:hypothetical protein n=1 Tax=Pseudomonas tritici TaxID=2745518 RepID=UPI00387B3398